MANKILPPIDSRAAALLAAKVADEEKATDIMIQEVRELMSATDYFVIVTAANYRQVDALIDKNEEELKKQMDIKPNPSEGIDAGTWALLDYGSFVVHVFQPEARDYYRLESLWNDAPVIDLKEAGITDAEYSDRIAKMLGVEPTIHTR